MDMSQYMEMFIEESKEHLQNMNESILQLEQDPEEKSLLNEIFRMAHTLKGMTGTMGFNKMAKLTHNMENLLDALRSDKKKVTAGIIDLLLKCFDALEEYLQNIIETESEGEEDYKDIMQELENELGGGSTNKPN